MKKFIVMIFSLSLFFLCLGGAAKQLLAILKFQTGLTATRRSLERERIERVEPRVFIRKNHPEIILDRTDERISENELMIHLSPPRISPDETATFPRFESKEPLTGSFEFRKVPGNEKVIIATPRLKE